MLRTRSDFTDDDDDDVVEQDHKKRLTICKFFNNQLLYTITRNTQNIVEKTQQKIIEILKITDTIDFTESLIHCAKRSQFSLVELFLEYGADPNIQISVNESLFKFLSYRPFHAVGEIKRIFDLLLATNSLILSKEELEAGLYYAIRQNFGDMVAIMIARGANVNARQAGKSFLIEAITCDNIESVCELLKVPDIDVNYITTSTGENACHVVRSLEMLDLLVKHGCNPNLVATDGSTVLSKMCGTYQEYKVKYLLRNMKINIPKNILQNCTYTNMEQVIIAAIDRGTAANLCLDNLPFRALREAVKRGNCNLIRLLLNLGVNIYSFDAIEGNDTTLLHIIALNHIILKMVIERLQSSYNNNNDNTEKLNFMIRNTSGETPMVNALHYNNLESIKLINSVDPTIIFKEYVSGAKHQDADAGMSYLHHSCRNDQDISRYFILCGLRSCYVDSHLNYNNISANKTCLCCGVSYCIGCAYTLESIECSDLNCGRCLCRNCYNTETDSNMMWVTESGGGYRRQCLYCSVKDQRNSSVLHKLHSQIFTDCIILIFL